MNKIFQILNSPTAKKVGIVVENLAFGSSLSMVGAWWVDAIVEFSIMINPVLASIATLVAIAVGIKKFLKKN